MKRFIEGESRAQATLFPERLDDWIAEDNPVRAVDAFVDELDLAKLGFEGAEPAATGRPAYHPGTLLKIYIYGYLNRLPSSRRLERETQRNLELIWLTGRLAPDFKTIADFRRDNGPAIRMGLAPDSPMADRSKLKEPDEVAEAVVHALFDAKPKRRYMVVPDEREAELTITKAIEELVQLNERQPYSYDRDELIKMLDAALDRKL